jgi:hypothetical protein
MTGDRRAAEAALEKGAVERAMEHVHDDERAELRGLLASVLAAQPLCLLAARVADAACVRTQVMLLANLTVSPAGAALLLQEGKGALEGASACAEERAWRLCRAQDRACGASEQCCM